MATNKNWSWNVQPSSIRLRKRKGRKKEKIECINVSPVGKTVQSIKNKAQEQEIDTSGPELIFKRERGRGSKRRRRKKKRKKSRVIV